MSKEYTQALEDLFGLISFQKSLTKEQFARAQKYIDTIEQALQRLESIDNANPSEALECLEMINPHLETELDRGIWNKQHDTIKQALLKAQEPKQYLKWEDLEIDNGNVRADLKVLLNGTKYRLSYFTNDTLKLLTNDEDFFLEIENEQFFNDLHLERAE